MVPRFCRFCPQIEPISRLIQPIGIQPIIIQRWDQREREHCLTRIKEEKDCSSKCVRLLGGVINRTNQFFAYEAGPIKLLVLGQLYMSSRSYLVEDRFFLSRKRMYLDYIPTCHLSTSSHKSHFKPPKRWML